MMNDSTRVMRRLRRVRPPVARTAAAIIATAVLFLLAAACGGGPSSTLPAAHRMRKSQSAPGQRTPSRSLSPAAYVPNGGRLPRSHPQGRVPKFTPQQVGVSSSRFQAAESACAHLLQPAQAQFRRRSPKW